MVRPQTAGIGIAGVGVVVVIAGGLLVNSSPDLRDRVHTMGLLIMLLGAGILLGAKYTRRMVGRVPISNSAQETARNLMIVGATFLVVGFALSVGLHWVLTPSMWAYWILIGLSLLGALAVIAGGLTYAAAFLFRSK